MIFWWPSSCSSQLAGDNEGLSSGHASVVKDFMASEGSMAGYKWAGSEMKAGKEGRGEDCVKHCLVMHIFLLIPFELIFFLQVECHLNVRH